MKVLPIDELATLSFGDGIDRQRSDAETAVSSFQQWPAAKQEVNRSSSDAVSLAEVPVIFHLADGGHLRGQLCSSTTEGDGVVGRTALGEAVVFRFDCLSGIQLAAEEAFPEADRQFQAALAARLPGRDLLITRGANDVQTLEGRVEQLDPDKGSFFFGRRIRSFATTRIYGIVLAAGAPTKDEKRHRLTVTMTEGSVFSARLVRADTCSVEVTTSTSLTTPLAISDIAEIRVNSERVVYLSDLSPVREVTEGLLHDAGNKDSPWPVRWDSSVSGGPLEIGGQTFAKGIGVHSRTELTFSIGDNYEKFVATIGLDDSIRPRGSVVFRVLGDGNVLYDSGVLTGKDEPRAIIVDVSKVDTLTLGVDYGPDLDLCDHADWGAARLLKPPRASTEIRDTVDTS
jgi:hypothetical protein